MKDTTLVERPGGAKIVAGPRSQGISAIREGADPPAARYRDRQAQRLGDHYYHSVLEILRIAFRQPASARGEMIRQARRVMHNLHDVGHLLGGRGEGLLFTAPREPKPGASAQSGRAPAFGVSVPRLLATLRTSGSTETADLARRHGQDAGELRNLLEDAAKGDGR